MAPARIVKSTPVLVVDRVEDSLPFWETRLGWKRTVEVPHGEAIGFVILVKDDIELMLQSRASIADDIKQLASEPFGNACLFVEVASLDDLRARLLVNDIIAGPRETFYGSREIITREPGGHIVNFAEFPKGNQA